MSCLIPKHFPIHVCDEFSPKFDELTVYDEDSLIAQVVDIKNAYIVVDTSQHSSKLYNIILTRCTCVQQTTDDRFQLYRLQSEEGAYLQLLKNVYTYGEHKPDRTGTGTVSTFGERLEFSLRNNTLPLLTTKSVYFKGVVEELLWFLRGSTDSQQLNSTGVKIWNQNGSLKNLNMLGFTNRVEGDLGPVYGFQWRHWGKTYIDPNTRTGAGVDQIADLIHGLQHEPHSRRHILSAWNVSDLKQMVLPPCHMCCQFYVSMNGELSCMMFQRSADLFLGVPFNIASYALLTHLLAKMTNLQPGKLVINFGDTHIYNNHLDAVKEQCSRTITNNFPKIHIADEITLESLSFSDIELIDYHHQPKISAVMAV